MVKKLVCILLLLSAIGAYAQQNQRYKIGLTDLMLLKRQKLGAIPLTRQIGADGLEVDLATTRQLRAALSSS